MRKPTISVIMAVYNAGKYLDESISSILNQTYANFELIIINDKSTDNSLDIIEKYQMKDKRIKLINNKKNIGPAASRNKALKLSKGKYIAIMDADDISLPTRFDNQYKFLEDMADIVLCGTGIIHIDEKNNIIDSNTRIVTGYEQIKKELPKNNCIAHSSVMYRNKNFRYREKFVYAHDYDLYLLLLSKGFKLENLQDVHIQYRNSVDNITCSKKIKQDLFTEKAKLFYKQRMKYNHDEYEQFQISEIINTQDIDSKKILLKFKLGFYLQNKDFKNVEKTLIEYQSLDSVSFFEIIHYHILIKIPQVYKLYRKIRYR